MNAEDAIRFLAHEAARCRDRDAHEALCLWLPALCKLLGVRPADDFEALAIQAKAHQDLRALNESPLVEAHCAACDFAEPLPEVRFDKTGQALHWCEHCQTQRYFDRPEVPA